jgi:hypothetical protein
MGKKNRDANCCISVVVYIREIPWNSLSAVLGGRLYRYAYL